MHRAFFLLSPGPFEMDKKVVAINIKLFNPSVISIETGNKNARWFYTFCPVGVTVTTSESRQPLSVMLH